MKHAIKSGLLVVMCCTVVTGPLCAADSQSASLADAIKHSSFSGQIRFGYINTDPEPAGNTTTSAAAIGGHIKMETGEWNRMHIAIAPYFSEKIAALSGNEDQGKLNGDFFDANNDSFAYLGEAYINYAFSLGTIRYGRQLIDTPFINPDDIRMAPITFDALWARVQVLDNLSLEGGKVSKWAGFSSGADQDKFKRASNEGVLALGAVYKLNDNINMQGWHYDFDKSYSQWYVDAIYTRDALELGAQFADYSEDNNSGIDGTAWGLLAGYDFGVIKLTGAINETSNDTGKLISNGLGGGNYFSSLDETNITGLNDASAYMVSVDWPLLDTLTLTGAYGHFEDGNKSTHDLDEVNFIVNWTIIKDLELGLVHTTVENDAAATDASSNFTRQVLIVNYNF